jgi:hypothetical protein
MSITKMAVINKMFVVIEEISRFRVILFRPNGV